MVEKINEIVSEGQVIAIAYSSVGYLLSAFQFMSGAQGVTKGKSGLINTSIGLGVAVGLEVIKSLVVRMVG